MGRIFKDYSGMVSESGRLKAIEYAGYHKNNKAMWRFECSCGRKDYIADAPSVFGKRKSTVSCGCLKLERLRALHAARRHVTDNWQHQYRLNGRFAVKGILARRIVRFDGGSID